MLLNFLQNLREVSFTEALLILLFGLVAVFLAFPIHEFAHGFAAYLLGDKTAKYQGRLTLNPIAHLDLYGFLMLAVLGFGWAKPVQFDPRNFKNRRLGTVLTAAAGPFANILAAFLSFGVVAMLTPSFAFYFQDSLRISPERLANIFDMPLSLAWVRLFFVCLGTCNVVFAIFNLIPVPPMDGSKIVGEALPLKYRIKYYSVEQYQYFIFLAILVVIKTTPIFDIMETGLSQLFYNIWRPLVGGLLA